MIEPAGTVVSKTSSRVVHLPEVSMTPFTALLAIIALFTVGVTFVAWVEGLAA